MHLKHLIATELNFLCYGEDDYSIVMRGVLRAFDYNDDFWTKMEGKSADSIPLSRVRVIMKRVGLKHENYTDIAGQVSP